jgi:glycerol-3-phosphate acyltransferase PlsY
MNFDGLILFISLMIIGYFMGSLPTGVYLGKKLKNIDIREHGSKNTGATNAYRVLGPKIGSVVLMIDILKGTIPVVIARLLGMGMGMGMGNMLVVIIGITAILGHSLSIFLNFKGGKGVATSAGVFIGLVPEIMVIIVLLFIFVVYVSKYISLGSITAAAMFPVLVLAFYRFNRVEVLVPAVLVAFFIIYKHKTNIERLLKGTENKFKIKPDKQA